MSSFDNKSLNYFSLQSNSTPECYVPHYVKSNSYLNSPPIHNNITSENLSITTSEEHVPPIENKWKYYSGKDGE